MFEKRLKVFLILLFLAALVVTGRLAQLQVAKGHHFRKLAANAMVRPTQYIPAVRGRILDRYGRLLAGDEPSWDLCMDYRAMVNDEAYIRQTAARWRHRNRLTTWPDLTDEEQRRRDETTIAKKIDESPALLAELTRTPVDKILLQREHVLKRVAAIQRYLLKKRGYFVPLEETRMAHPVVRGLDDQTAVQAKLALADLDWLAVRASTRRIYHDATAMGHVMGRCGQVTAEARRDDPFKDDDLRRYLLADTFGVAGVEKLCEPLLRGRRGRIEVDIDGEEIDRVAPVDAGDAVLAIDADLQQKVYDALAKAVKNWRLSTGGAAVVLHIPTREVLALVSYPAFDPNLFRKDFEKLRDDVKGRPTLFRAVAGVYPPGSVIKAATLTTALGLNLITPETRLDCKGYLHNPKGCFKCWIYSRHGISHAEAGFPNGLCAEEALQVSCNCYFYQLGEKVRGDRLCQWLRQFYRGPEPPPGMIAGTGLIEERPGILPTAAWLWEHQRRPMRLGDSRNYAIGQGELGLTPLQVASLMATLASGKYQWPTLILKDQRERPVWDLGVKKRHWQTVRNGLYRVVNHPKGTAYGRARMDEITVAGKTGSAQCSRIVVARRYVVERPDGRREKIVARNRAELEKKLGPAKDRKVLSSRAYRYWPPKVGKDGAPISCAHAWFAGFVPGDPDADPQFAVAALVEFGESGGRRAAPLFKDIIRALLESPHSYVRRKSPTDPS